MHSGYGIDMTRFDCGDTFITEYSCCHCSLSYKVILFEPLKDSN